MPQHACIFCQRAKPLVTITKEHLFSRWVDDVLTSELLGPDRSFERTVAGPDGVATSKSWPVEIVAVIEAPVVCGSCEDGCNEGWMSDLDGQVKHILKPMMLGEPRAITPTEQLTIAVWAAMKAMVLEYVWGSDQPVVSPQVDRTFLFEQKQPPRNMQIRIAAVESQGRPTLATRRVYKRDSIPGISSGEPDFAFCVTFVLGCFVVQIFGGPGAPASSRRPPDRPDFYAIYPERDDNIAWPPPQPLDDAALDKFAHPLQPITHD